MNTMRPQGFREVPKRLSGVSASQKAHDLGRLAEDSAACGIGFHISIALSSQFISQRLILVIQPKVPVPGDFFGDRPGWPVVELKYQIYSLIYITIASIKAPTEWTRYLSPLPHYLL
jgi:hypothetical protein